MSGIVSGISTAFKAVGSAAARIGSAVKGVGTAVFSAGAASAAAPLAAGGLAGIVQSFTGTGVLGNILTGAITQAGYGALIGGAIGAMTGTGFGKGALMGAAGGAVSGGLFGAAGLNPDPLTQGFAQPPGASSGVAAANTVTGVAPVGATASAASSVPATAVASTVPAAAPGGGFGAFLQSENGGALIGGLGKGLGSYMESKQKEEMAAADRKFLLDKEMRVRDSYNVAPSALHGPVVTDNSQRPAPASKYARTHRYAFDPAQGRVVQVPV